MLLFLIKLVLVPVIVMIHQPWLGTLPRLPDRGAMERALLIETAAYVAFCIAIRFVPARPRSSGFWAAAASLLEGTPSLLAAAAFAGVGAAGFAAAFGSIGNLQEYFVNPSILGDLNREAEGSLASLAGTILRPFLAVSFVLLWCRVADTCQTSGSRFRQASITLLAVCGILAANSTFSFNRAAFVFPLLALTAVFVDRVRHIPPLVLAGLAALVAVPILLIGVYRANSKTSGEVVEEGLSSSNLSEQIQVYANGPQFLGYFLDHTGWGRSLYWGRTLVASALDPVPVLGKSFRESSGAYLYNWAIYNQSGNVDQIIPLQGELFINFHLPGVVAGYFLVGLLIGQLQRRSETAGSAFAAFAIGYAALWTGMLIVWSLSVFSQILVYFFWPFYSYLGWNWIRRWFGNRGLRPAWRTGPSAVLHSRELL